MPDLDSFEPGGETDPSFLEMTPSSQPPVSLASAKPRSSMGDNTSIPQQSFSAYVFTGPFMLGQSLKAGGAGLNSSVLLGAAVNLSVLGWMVNVATQRPSPMDPFGPFVAGVAQIGAGLLITPLATSK